MTGKDKAPVLVIPAAGRGKRMGGEKNKLFMLLEGKPVLAHTIANSLQTGLFAFVLAVIAPGEEEDFRRWVMTPFFDGEERIFTVKGGGDRQQSVYNALHWLCQEKIEMDRVVCVHDGARPLLDKEIAWQGFREAQRHGAAVPGLPLKDTVKETDKEHNVTCTPDRGRLVAVQTPQCFSFSVLWKAYYSAEANSYRGSDDASLVEAIGEKVKVFPGSENNIKLTTPLDYKIAEALLSLSGHREEAGEEDDFLQPHNLRCR